MVSDARFQKRKKQLSLPKKVQKNTSNYISKRTLPTEYECVCYYNNNISQKYD